MNQPVSILEQIMTYLPEMREKMGERWLHFVQQIQPQALLFKTLSNEPDLEDAIEQLYGLFMEDEITREILTRPRSNGMAVSEAPQPLIEAETSLQTLANRFYLLCQHANTISQQHEPAEYLKELEARPSTGNHRNQHGGGSYE